jgi:hypothetical protein
LLAGLLALDCAWSLVALVEQRGDWSNTRLWLLLNAIAGVVIALALFLPAWPNGTEKWDFLAAVAILRTLLDNAGGHSFYWPGLTLGEAVVRRGNRLESTTSSRSDCVDNFVVFMIPSRKLMARRVLSKCGLGRAGVAAFLPSNSATIHSSR